MSMRLNRLRSVVLSLAILFGVLNAMAIAQPTSSSAYLHDWDPRSGDVWVDRTLADINRYAQAYPESFIDEISRYYDAPRGFVAGLVVQEHWAPGDVYYACAIARVLGRPCRAVADAWAQDHEKGWNAVARQLGVEPGSTENARLKQGFLITYAHWARPLVLDNGQQPATALPERSPDAQKVSTMPSRK